MGVESNKSVSYYYKVYGLIIKSEVLLSELVIANKDEITIIDTEIIYGSMTKDIKESLNDRIIYKFQREDMWFTVENVAHYHITNGDKIIVEPLENAEEAQIKAFLLGTAFGLLLIQRTELAIHGGTILVDDNAVVFTGDTGAGKSTMTAAFREKGYFFMADDVSVVRQANDSSHLIYPGYPQQKLCRDAVENMGYDPKDFTMIDDDREKYIIPTRESFVYTPMPIGAIVELSIGEGDSLEITEILGIEKITALMKNIYRIEVTRFAGLSSEYLNKCIEIVKNVPIYRIKRPKGRNTVEEQIALVLRALEDKKTLMRGV